MSETPRLPSAVLDHPVWSKLFHYTIGPENAALSFEQRLARENGWRADFTRRVIEEYHRFVFLATVAGHEVTPSDAVDQAWHLHLTYTRDYWERFCPTVIGRPLHHGPTAGGADEQHRFFDQYAATLAAYEHWFGQTPPADIWPDARRRFFRDPLARRVDPATAFILPRRTTLVVLGALAILALSILWLSLT
ncbi:glycine-rich domain-containing protein [Sphingomonas alpina]|uniref:Uncharacterized protein n=1 Tax=Sphingomonas alpina TaxID=653931 RepID=A0A7H0LH00_9SPHN|nr:hypothetical protein [Sphingomonas alpina]QNQ08953.1 hypothetical protein H3Z74_19980 [Sphingomonas alpina]